MAVVPLVARSRHSLGFGTASVTDLARRAAELGVRALGLTDIETMAGQVRFHDACAREGVRPVTGVELRAGYGRSSVGGREMRLVLLARDETGYASLCRILSRRRIAAGARPAPDPLSSLDAGSEGLFLLADDASVLTRLLERDDVDDADVRGLLVRPAPPDADRELREAAAGAGVPLVADLDLAVLDRADRPLHALLLAVREGTRVDEVRAATTAAGGAGAFEAASAEPFRDAPQAVEEAHRIAVACRLDLLEVRRIPPRLPGTEAGGAVAELRARCLDSLASGRSRGRFRGRPYDERLAEELATIERLGFADYLLAVGEIVRGARDLGIGTAGRGSAAGSLAAHLLGVTQIDPVETDLLFERFLHDAREAPPDIDLDVSSSSRDALNAWIVRRFGRERVAGVASYGTFRARSAVRSGLTALGVAPRHVEEALRRLEGPDASGEEEAAHVEGTLGADPHPAVRAAAGLVSRMVGLPSHLSAHPGGVIIGDGPLEERTPLDRAPGGIVTQYDGRSVERAGFLKIDLLGSHFLAEAQVALPGAPLPHPTEGGGGADAAWRTLNAADTVGLFQVESPAMRSVLRRLPLTHFPDLVAALAVVRPGAAAGAQKERFVRRARGEEPWEPLEILGEGATGPRYAPLRERLARTYGVLLYDEDIIRLLSTVGGMGPGEADAMRSAIIAAGEAPAALARLQDAFVAAAVASGVPRAVAERAWSAAARFAAYSFAEAHAASYAVQAWQAAWLRNHRPTEFGAALLDHHRGLYPLRTTAAAVARWGVRLLPPDVQVSDLASAPEAGVRGTIRVGLAAIKGLTKRTAADLLEGRPFGELGDLIERARPSKGELRSLLLSGACDGLPPLSPDRYPFVHEAVLAGLVGDAAPDSLGEAIARADRPAGTDAEGERVRAYRRLVRVRNEIRTLDMHVSDHPIHLLRPEADRLGCVPTSALGERLGRRVRLAALLAATRRVETSRGPLRFVTFEDEEGLFEGVLLPPANERLGVRITTPGPYLAEGVVRDGGGDPSLEVVDLTPFHERS